MIIITTIARPDGSIEQELIELPDVMPPEPTPDEQRDLLLAQLYENQLLMLNGMNDLVKI